MPVTTSYPGIYIEELPSNVHTITAAPTSIAVFVGYSNPFSTIQFNKPIELFSFTDYQRWFGGFFGSDHYAAEAPLFGDLAQAVNQFFLNGGSDAYVIGLLPQALAPFYNTAQSPALQLPGVTVGPLTFYPLQFVDNDHAMQVTITNTQSNGSPPNDTADVIVTFGPPPSSPLSGYGSVAETYRSVSMTQYLGPNKLNPNYILTRINNVSSLVRVAINSIPGLLQATAPSNPSSSYSYSMSMPTGIFPPTFGSTPRWQGFNSSGNSIGAPVIFRPDDFTQVFLQDSPLDKLPIFNLLVIPGVTDNSQGSVLATAGSFCEGKRAFLIMDPPIDNSADGSDPPGSPRMEDTMEGNSQNGETIPLSANSAIYFPYLTTNDPVTGLASIPGSQPPIPFEMPPSGTVAGIFASTDTSFGVWKAPAGLVTVLTNVNSVVERGQMNDQRNGVLNLDGVNCIRDFPGIGSVVWGARTSISANPSYQQWKYVPVRRMALFLEQTLYANLGWVVFEPNDEPLWTAIRTSIESFMLGLFRQGAFQGSTPSEAFQVKCDNQTTTQDDINNGIVNIVVAFAPLKPAEFVIIKISQLAGQTQTS